MKNTHYTNLITCYRRSLIESRYRAHTDMHRRKIYPLGYLKPKQYKFSFPPDKLSCLTISDLFHRNLWHETRTKKFFFFIVDIAFDGGRAHCVSFGKQITISTFL